MKNSSPKAFSFSLLLFLSTVSGFAQTLSGTIDVGAGQTYTTLTGSTGSLFNAINNGVVAGDITVRITSDIIEPGNVALNKWTESGIGNYQLKIVPDGTTERVLSGSSVNMFNFSNVRNLVIDGSFSGTGKFLRFINTHKNASTLAFVNDCKSDTVMNCNFEGVDTASNKSILLIGTTNIAGGTGNDSIAILNNIIKDNAAGYPKNLVRSVGTAAAPNDNCIISGNEFMNWSNEAVGLATGTGDNWKILNNAFYQSPTANILTSFYGIRAIAGNGHLIAENSIGGTAPDRSGTPMKTSSSVSNVYSITGISIGSGSTLSPILITKNNVSNIKGQFSICGISLETANANIDSNTIKDLTITGAGYTSILSLTGLNMIGSNTTTITNNIIRKIQNNTQSSFLPPTVAGIYGSGSNCQYNVSYNIVDSIVAAYSAQNPNFANTQIPVGLSISLSGLETINVISHNIVSNVINTSYLSATGINYSSSNTASTNIFNNQIYNVGGLLYDSGNPSNTLVGIQESGGGNDTIYNNTINIGTLSNSITSIYGIRNGGSGTAVYYNNTVKLTGAQSVRTSFAFYRTYGNVLLRNNIFNNARTRSGSAGSYAIGNANTTGFNSDYNLIFAADSICALWGTAGKTFAAWKTASNGDTNSVNAPVTFVSATDLHIEGSNANAWNVYGRGIAIPAISTDIDGDSRSTIVGTPVTIGADEIAMPSATPANMIMTPATLNAGTPAVFTSAGKRIAEITWTGGVVPNTITGKYYPGVPAPNATTSPNANSYFELTPDVTTGIPYTIKTYYTDAEAAGITDANLQAIKSHTPGSWIGITSANANTKDANGKYLQSVPLNDFSTFTMTGSSIPLSIDLKTIAAQNIGSKNKITWSTAKEEKEDYFELESSTDDRTFKKIATIMAKGQASTYAYWDEKAVLGMNYYRLKMMTASGSFVYSKTVMAEVKATTSFAMSAYPNPVVNKASISIKGTIHEDAMIVITDINGKQLKTISTVSNAMDVSLDDLASGIYFLKYSDSQQSQTIKITKQ